MALPPYLPLGDALDDLMRRGGQILPAQIMDIVGSHLTDLVNHPRPNLLSIGLLVALWSASRGVNAFRTGLNLAYDVQESRPYWRVQLLCIGMTLLTTLMVLISLALMIIGGLTDVVSKQGGTAVGAFEGFPLDQYPIAGKTGTAQKAGQQAYSVFVGFGPVPSPKYSVAVVIEQGGFGRQAGALVRRMFEGIAGFTIGPVRTVTQGGTER